MPAYCTEEDILALELTETELITLTDDDKSGCVDSTKVTAAIDKADRTDIDPACRGRYDVPFSPVPDEIKYISATIAAYYLCRRRQKVSTSVIDRYQKALSKLKKISEGNYSLEGATEATDSSGIASTTEDVAHTFTRTKKDSNGNVISKGTMETW